MRTKTKRRAERRTPINPYRILQLRYFTDYDLRHSDTIFIEQRTSKLNSRTANFIATLKESVPRLHRHSKSPHPSLTVADFCNVQRL